MSWSAMTARNTARLRWVLAFMAAWAIVFSVSFAMGATPAYASDSSSSATGGASAASLSAAGDGSGVPLAVSGDDPMAPIDPTNPTGGAKGASGSASAASAAPVAAAADASAAAVDSVEPSESQQGASSQEGASTPDAADSPGETVLATSGDDQQELLASSRSYSYPRDDGDFEIFVSISPCPTESYNESTAVITSDLDSSAIYVDIDSEVGRGVDLAIQVDYVRIGGIVYDVIDGGSKSVTLPTESIETNPRTVYANHFMTSWYEGTAPLGQGSYRADVASSGESGMSSGKDHFDVDARCFEWGNYGPAKYLEGRYTSHEIWANSSSVPYESLVYPYYTNRYDGSPFYFETRGERVFTAQFTYLQEFRETTTDEEGEVTYVSYLLYVSNPVIFRINVVDKTTIDLVLDLMVEGGGEVNYDEGFFEVDIRKEYHGYSHSYGYDGNFAYCRNWNNQFRYEYATDGLYFIEIQHSAGLYEPVYNQVYLDEGEYQYYAQSGYAFVVPITLIPVQIELFTVTFYAEDGTTILPVEDVDGSGNPVYDSAGNRIMVDSKQYNKNTFGWTIREPNVPAKAEDAEGKYAFSGWRERSTGNFYHSYSLPDVYCNADYIAVYRVIPTTNEPKARFVYATGGLFGKAKPAGVASYQLTSNELSEAKKAAIVEEHSGMIAESKVLGVFEVGITQHNNDGTTASVTEGVGDLNLTFDLEGIADGTKVRALQLHETGDVENPVEVIEHNGLVVEDGKVSIKLDDKLSTFIILEDAEGFGDDGSEGVSIGINPRYLMGELYGADPTDPNADPSVPVTTDANGVTNVYITVDRGDAIDLGVAVDYLRMNNQTYQAGDTVSLPITITEGSTSQRACDYFMVNWYSGDTPLPRGTYYSDPQAYEAANPGSTGGQQMPSYESYEVSPMLYIYQSAYFGYDNGDGNGRVYYSFPEGYERLSYSPSPTMRWSGDEKTLTLGEEFYLTANQFMQLYFPYATMYNTVFTAQVTYVEEYIEARTDENGNKVNFVTHVVHASNPIVFHINVRDSESASLEIRIVDENNDPVDIYSWNPANSQFDAELDKKYKNIDDPSDDYQMHYYDTVNYVILNSSLRYDDLATAGIYKFSIAHTLGLYRRLVTTFELTADDIHEASEKHESIIKTFQIESVDPVTYEVTFVDYDDTLLLGPIAYGENTYGTEIRLPSPLPNNKPEDNDYKYVFQSWEVVGSGYTTTVPEMVTRDVTYRAAYKAIPKVNDPITPRVYASGGLFGKAKPTGVASYQLTSNQLDPSTDANAAAMVARYSAEVGNSKVVGMFEVGITQHNDDGTTEPVTTGVGEMSLNFKLDGVADGTKVKVLQVHETGDPLNPEKLIVHSGMTVVNGEVGITLHDELSTFIVLEDLEAQGDDAGDDPADEPSDPSAGDDPADPAAGDNPADEPSDPSSGDDPADPSDEPSGDTPSGDTPAAEEPTNETPASEEPAPSSETPSQASSDVEDFINNGSSDDEAATRGVPSNESKIGEGGLSDDGAGPEVAESIKAGSAPDGGKTIPQTSDSWSPMALVLVVLGGLIAAFAAVALYERGRNTDR